MIRTVYTRLHFDEKLLCIAHTILAFGLDIALMIFVSNFGSTQESTVNYMINNWGEFYQIGAFEGKYKYYIL